MKRAIAITCLLMGVVMGYWWCYSQWQRAETEWREFIQEQNEMISLQSALINLLMEDGNVDNKGKRDSYLGRNAIDSRGNLWVSPLLLSQ